MAVSRDEIKNFIRLEVPRKPTQYFLGLPVEDFGAIASNHFPDSSVFVDLTPNNDNSVSGIISVGVARVEFIVNKPHISNAK